MKNYNECISDLNIFTNFNCQLTIQGFFPTLMVLMCNGVLMIVTKIDRYTILNYFTVKEIILCAYIMIDNNNSRDLIQRKTQ